MHQIYFMSRIYPYWALPSALVLGQLAMHFRRRKNKLQYYFWFMILFFTLSGLAWIFFRGDLHSDDWVGWLFNS